MSDSGNIRRHFHPVGKPDSGNLSKRRVWFLGSGRGNLDADAALEGAVRADRTIFERIENPLHCRRFGFHFLNLARPFFELVDRRHK